MSSLQITMGVAAAVLLFWAVGAYNRLMTLRNTLARRFERYDEQVALRHALLIEHLDQHATLADGEAADVSSDQPDNAADAAASPMTPPTLARSLRAACAQVYGACAAARARPDEAGPITSLRLAEDILQQAIARDREAAEALPGFAELAPRLTVCETGLQYARRQFNAAADEYNRAVRQFPACLLAGSFGFRATGVL